MSDFRYKIKIHLSVIILTAILICLSSCGHFRLGGFFGNRSLKKAILWAKQDSTRVADSLKNFTSVKRDTLLVQQDPTVKVVAEKKLTVNNRKSYYIIIGTFGNPENAKTAAKSYQDKGYKTTILNTVIGNGDMVELVSVKTFGNRDEANRYLVEFRSKTDSSAWIFPNKY